jgi:hypothetical protein
MEPAFGGVKSNEKPPAPGCCVNHREHCGELEGAASSVYLRFMIEPAAERSRYYRFLRQLRADGRTNMYGAVPYLMKAFGLNRETAFSVVCQWLDLQAQPEAEALPRRHRKLSTSSA